MRLDRVAADRSVHPRVDLVLDPVEVGRAHQDPGRRGHRSAPPDGSWTPSSVARLRRNGSTSVTRPTVWNVPRSLSLVTVAGLMSTETTLTQAGSRLPVAIECRAVAIIRAKPTPRIARRIVACACRVSVITSGIGPSSRIDPA